MKRILFWASGMFALGEVTYIYGDRMTNYSIALAMLICLAVIFVKRRKYFARISFLCGFVVFGFVYIMISDELRPVSLRFNQGDIVSIESEKRYDMYCYGSGNSVNYYIEDYGIVTEIDREKQSVTVKMGNGLGTYKVIIYQVCNDFFVGDRVSVRGEVSTFSEPTNPGTMNMRKYYGGKGVLFSSNKNLVGLETFDGNEGILEGVEDLWYKLVRRLDNLKNSFGEKIKAITDDYTAGFMISLLLGDKTNLDEELKVLFQMSGISHVLVISGLHISLIGGLIYKLFNILGFNKNLGGVLTILIIIFYGNMTGAGYATIRAVIMLVVSIVGDRLSRDYDMLTSMSMALFIMLLMNPFCILDGGMLLSFGAIGGVALGSYFTKNLIGARKLKKLKKNKPVRYYFTTTFVMSLSVNIILTPLMCTLFCGFPLYSVFLNIIIIPLMTAVTSLGLLGLFLSYISLAWGYIIYLPLKYILKFMVFLCRGCMKMPFSYVCTGKLSLIVIIIYYVAVLMTVLIINPSLHKKVRDLVYEKWHISMSKRKWRNVYIGIWGIVVLIAAITICFTHKSTQRDALVFADVGQGDGAFIRIDEGINMVIDGGSTSNESVGEYVIVPILKYMNMTSVDYWFISHCDEDHISGLMYVLEAGDLCGIEVKNIVLGKEGVNNKDSGETNAVDYKRVELCKLAKLNGTNIITMSAGDYISFGDNKMTCLSPEMGYDYEDKNQASMALSFESAWINVLFTGDMDSEVLEYMIETRGNLLADEYDVLKIPHHGSKYSMEESLYSYVSGGYGIISCGKNNMYGHPHNEVVDSLSEVGIRVLRTDLVGGISISHISDTVFIPLD